MDISFVKWVVIGVVVGTFIMPKRDFIETKEVVKVEYRDVFKVQVIEQEKIIYREKIKVVKVDGTVIEREVDRSHEIASDKQVERAVEQVAEQTASKRIEKSSSISDYSFDLLTNLNIFETTLGVRLGGLPILGLVGVEVDLNNIKQIPTVKFGLRVEF